ncbi:MAG: 3-dehydroquinate synthase [Spirochaetota bacterium]
MYISQERVHFGSVDYSVKLYESLTGLAEELQAIAAISKVVVFTEKKIANIYGNELKQELEKSKLAYSFIILKGGERNKHIDRLKAIYNQLIDENVDRKSLVLAFGGGVVGDFAGYVAASYLRGVRFIQVPTTLLACVDSSVGGKVAVNVDRGKNMVGAFHQPSLVYAPLNTLETLPRREWRCGLAEVIKHSLLQGGEFFAKIQNFTKNDFQAKSELVEYSIRESVKFKASIVEQDEKESGIRSVLNLGHTLGHAIESFTHYKKYSHGEAVAIGLVTALLLSQQVYALQPEILKSVFSIYQAIDMPYKEEIAAEELIMHMKHDKKTQNAVIRFVLLQELGKPTWNNEMQDEVLQKLIEKHWELEVKDYT